MLIKTADGVIVADHIVAILDSGGIANACTTGGTNINTGVPFDKFVADFRKVTDEKFDGDDKAAGKK